MNLIEVNLVGRIKYMKVVNSWIEEELSGFLPCIEMADGDYFVYDLREIDTERAPLNTHGINTDEKLQLPFTTVEDMMGLKISFQGRIHEIEDIVLKIDGSFDFVLWEKEQIILPEGVNTIEELAEKEYNEYLNIEPVIKKSLLARFTERFF